MVPFFQNSSQGFWKEGAVMKGYNTDNGYMGYVNGSYILFASEEDYREYMAGWQAENSTS